MARKVRFDEQGRERGLTLEELKTDPMVLEEAMLRVRLRHEEAGDTDKLTFGDLLMEAKKEAQDQYERLARGETILSRAKAGKINKGVPLHERIARGEFQPKKDSSA